MPTFEGSCENPCCLDCGQNYEYFLKKWDNPNPKCPACDIPVSRAMSAPMISWAKPMGQYCGENSEGHFATARDPETGAVEKHFITSRKDQKDFCKRYGYYDPTEIPTEVTAGKDGKQVNTTGSKGAWI